MWKWNNRRWKRCNKWNRLNFCSRKTGKIRTTRQGSIKISSNGASINLLSTSLLKSGSSTLVFCNWSAPLSLKSIHFYPIYPQLPTSSYVKHSNPVPPNTTTSPSTMSSCHFPWWFLYQSLKSFIRQCWNKREVLALSNVAPTVVSMTKQFSRISTMSCNLIITMKRSSFFVTCVKNNRFKKIAPLLRMRNWP